MASAEAQKPNCPVCQKADKVKKLQAAYNEGMERFAPPPLPGKTVSMLRYMMFSMLIVGICVFMIIVFIGSESFGQDISIPELILVAVTLICIVAALVLSYIAFTKVVQGDQQAQKSYPEWDSALQRWNSLCYCARDDIVFDPQTGKVVSEEALASLRSAQIEQGKQASQSSTSLAHHSS